MFTLGSGAGTVEMRVLNRPRAKQVAVVEPSRTEQDADLYQRSLETLFRSLGDSFLPCRRASELVLEERENRQRDLPFSPPTVSSEATSAVFRSRLASAKDVSAGPVIRLLYVWVDVCRCTMM